MTREAVPRTPEADARGHRGSVASPLPFPHRTPPPCDWCQRASPLSALSASARLMPGACTPLAAVFREVSVQQGRSWSWGPNAVGPPGPSPSPAGHPPPQVLSLRVGVRVRRKRELGCSERRVLSTDQIFAALLNAGGNAEPTVKMSPARLPLRPRGCSPAELPGERSSPPRDGCERACRRRAPCLRLLLCEMGADFLAELRAVRDLIP